MLPCYSDLYFQFDLHCFAAVTPEFPFWGSKCLKLKCHLNHDTHHISLTSRTPCSPLHSLRSMAKWLKELNFGSRRDPPLPPRPDYTESEILRAYRAQKELDFEDPYQPSDKQIHNGGYTSCSATVSLPSFPAFGSVLPNGVEVRRLASIWAQRLFRTAHPNNFILEAAPPWVLSNTPAKCEVVRMSGCPEDRRTGVHWGSSSWSCSVFTVLCFLGTCAHYCCRTQVYVFCSAGQSGFSQTQTHQSRLSGVWSL